MSDKQARAAISNALDDTLVVEAAAGTGKTTELVKRVLRVLATGRARIFEIVSVTFTEKAAGELKLRLREGIEADRATVTDPDERERLERALEKLEEAHVNTIHGFCADLLRERPVEARVDPVFTVLTEPQSERLYTRAFRAWLQEALDDPPEGLRRALRRSSAMSFRTTADDGPVERLRGAGRALDMWRDFPAAWRRPPFDRDGQIDRLTTALHDFAAVTSTASSDRDNLYVDLAAVRRLSAQIQLEQSFGQADYDGWESRLVDLVRDRGFSRPRKGYGTKYGTNVPRALVLESRETLFGALQQFKRDADGDLAACLQQELRGATRRYQELKAAAGSLDFTDLLARARDLLATHSEVRRYLQAKFTRIFVDEFQDTDPIQAEILLLLSAADPTAARGEDVRPVPGKLFIVGDPKQAIYRFRGTDVGTYWRVTRQLERHGARVLQLTTSYRALPAIQALVNTAFADEMREDELVQQAAYVALDRFRSEVSSQPSVVVLPVPRPYPARGRLVPSAKAIERSLPDIVGAYIEWLTTGPHGWTVMERGPDGRESQVPIRARHIAVLFRRFVSFGEDVTRPYLDAIEARSIPHLLVGGRAFHGREEVETIRVALAAVEWPDDALSVFATLRGSLFAIDDAHLLDFKERFGTCHPFRVPRALGGNSGGDLELTADSVGHLAPIADALRQLQRLHRGRNSRPVADTIGRLLGDTRAHVGFILRPAGEQALANVLHVAELARQYEAGGGISFRGFIDELRAAAESDATEAPILEESSDGVRLMTVHKAKGLEFPIVILADLTCRASRGDASRFVDPARGLCAVKLAGWAPHDLHDHEAEEVGRDQAESVRLAYVAATRARDLLVVPALGDGPWDGGWFGVLNRAIYPPLDRRRMADRGPACPAFTSRDSVLERPDGDAAGPATVSPGLHGFDAAGYSVVWWDPRALNLGAKPPFGVRRDDLIVKDVAPTVIADGRTTYDAWRLARIDARQAGSAPSLRVKTVREWTADDPAGVAGADAGGAWDSSGASTVAIVDAWPGRSSDAREHGGAVFGTLVHAVLALAPFGADRASIDHLATVESRVMGLDEADRQAAARIVERVLGHELLVRARAADGRGACRREAPVTAIAHDGTLVEGVVDLAFEEDGVWSVVDYKTDRELLAAGEDRYRRQVAFYADAIGRATGAPALGIILRV